MLFTFIYKTGDALSVKDADDLQLINTCLDLVLKKLESASNQQVRHIRFQVSCLIVMLTIDGLVGCRSA